MQKALDFIFFLFVSVAFTAKSSLSIRFPTLPEPEPSNLELKTAVFALGCFWRSEAAFGCLDGVVRTTAGYSGGSKPNPEYRSLGNHAECVKNLWQIRNKLGRNSAALEATWSYADK